VKALSVMQPYATLLACGAKRVETRSWRPSGLEIGEWLAIHASQRLRPEWVALAASEPYARALGRAQTEGLTRSSEVRDLPRGCVVAVARFAGVVPGDSPVAHALSADERAFGFYGPGRWGWVFDAVRSLREPIPASGMLGLWTWEEPPDLDQLLLPVR
jgi:hypothetical protein